MYARKSPPPRRGQRGLSIVEIMVAMVVALLVSLAATGSAAMFTAAQRQGMGATGAAVNAGTALAALKNDAAAAGLGFFGDSKYLCRRLNLSMGAAVVQDGAAFTPVQVTTLAAGDQVDVVYGTQVASGANVLLNTSTTGATAELRSLLPVSEGQAVLLAPNEPDAATAPPCMVRSVTGVAAWTTATPQTLTFANSASAPHNQAVFTTPSTLPDRGRVTLLGELNWSRYNLVGTDLTRTLPMTGASAVLVRNVVAFRAQYGLADSAAGSTALETWQSADGAFATLDPGSLPRVRALRIGVVTRSPQAEKPDASGVCQATTAMPELFGAAVTSDVTDWRCFRYRTSIVVVPLRNLVMGMTP
jgi:type IV pilus assembly protein PilW